MTKSELLRKISKDEYLRQYIETALWSSSDDDGEPLDKNYYIEDFTADGLKKMVSDAEKFLDKPGVDEAVGSDYSQAAHDFWLTRNGHGAGFWDGDWPEPEATFLTEVSEKFGEVDLYVHRGKVHVYPG